MFDETRQVRLFLNGPLSGVGPFVKAIEFHRASHQILSHGVSKLSVDVDVFPI